MTDENEFRAVPEFAQDALREDAPSHRTAIVERIFLVLLFAAAFLVRVWGMSRLHVWDENVYLLNAEHICCGKHGFNELDSRTLRSNLVAAGNDPLVSNREGGVPTTVISPSILFDELEVKRTDKKNAKLPEYPPPDLAGH